VEIWDETQEQWFRSDQMRVKEARRTLWSARAVRALELLGVDHETASLYVDQHEGDFLSLVNGFASEIEEE